MFISFLTFSLFLSFSFFSFFSFFFFFSFFLPFIKKKYFSVCKRQINGRKTDVGGSRNVYEALGAVGGVITDLRLDVRFGPWVL